jgi:alkylation response protein AidB-like acyl-CoA dehydrogenase
MMAAISPRSESRTTPDELLKRAQKIAEISRERAGQTEQDRRVSTDMVEMMRSNDLFRILQPAEFGGFEYGFDLFVDVAATIAEGCGSTGWICSIGMVHQWLISLFPLEAQRDVWSKNPGAIAYGSYAPAGQAVVADGGFRLSGNWSFSSGCDNAQWFLLGGLIDKSGGGKEAVFYLVDAAQCSIDDTWFTMGLAGTGSKTVVVDNVFVPSHRVVRTAELTAGTSPGALRAKNPLYKVSLLALLPLCLVAPTLGMARGALKSFLQTLQTRVTRGAVAGANNRMAEFATVQLRVAEATASIDAGHLLIVRDIAETIRCVQQGGAIPVDMRIRNRLDHAFCAKLFTQAVDALFMASGGNAIYSDKEIQRSWRDIHAANVHISLNLDAVGTMYGQYALGLEPKGQY